MYSVNNLCNNKTLSQRNDFMKQIYNYIENLVSDKAIYQDSSYQLSVNDLENEELGILANLFIENNKRETDGCFHNPDQLNKDDDISCALLDMLKDKSPENMEKLSDLIFYRSIENYKTDIQEAIDHICKNKTSETMKECGLYPINDKINGEISWMRI